MESTKYRLLFFSANRLERWEEVDAGNYLQAVEQAARRADGERTELWSEGKRLASFGAAGGKTRL